MVRSQTINDRGGGLTTTKTTDACRAHLQHPSYSARRLDIRQTTAHRRNVSDCCQEWFCFGFEQEKNNTELVYINQDQTKIATSIEEDYSGWFCRVCCGPCHPFQMMIREEGTGEELLAVHRPVRCCVGACKCCCYQKANISSGGRDIGSIQEQFYWCIPTFRISDDTGQDLYTIHPPTCGPRGFGVCYDCYTEGNPCFGSGCCKIPFWIFDANNQNQTTNGKHAEHVGKILKKPKSIKTEIFTNASAFEVTFPNPSSVEQKALLVGSTVFLNAVFFDQKG